MIIYTRSDKIHGDVRPIYHPRFKKCTISLNYVLLEEITPMSIVKVHFSHSETLVNHFVCLQ